MRRFGNGKRRFDHIKWLVLCELCGIKSTEMIILLTGSLGDISKPLAKELVQKGHTVTVIKVRWNSGLRSIERPVLVWGMSGDLFEGPGKVLGVFKA